jgi:two-component system, chemotaxis family, sensor kinase CheA
VDLDLARYLGLFVSEARSNLDKAAAVLGRMSRGEAGPDPGPLVDELFRHAHSVKGMAATMQFDRIALLAHRAEDVIGSFRGRGTVPGPEVLELLLSTLDGLSAMVDAVAEGRPAEPDPALLARITHAAAIAKGAPPPEEPAAAPPDPAGDEPPAVAPAAEAAPAARRIAVEVEVAATCPVPAVRGFLVLKRLEGLGRVTSAHPGADDLRAGRMPGLRLAAEVETSQAPDAVERAVAQIADLARVAVREVAPPAAPEAPAPRPEAPAEAPRTVRVRAELLDDLLDVVGELLLSTARLRELGRTVAPPRRRLHEEAVDRLHGVVKDLHGKVMSARMTPLTLLSDRLPRAARDLARRSGRQVEVVVAGAEVEVDRGLLDDVTDPVLHLLRNAVDHGIEPVAERIAHGKRATGRIEVSARRERDRVILEIADDGRGMDPDRLRQAAVERGAVTAAAAAALSDADALLLACLPGVSTAAQVTDVSGRGVGMDAVKRTVEGLGGTLRMESQRGKGTRVTLRLPLTVAVQPVLLVRVADELFGLPVSKVHGAAEAELAGLERAGGAPQLGFGGGHVPVHELGRLLGLRPEAPAGRRSVVVMEGEGGRLGLAVDQLLGQEEAVLKPLHGPLALVPGLSAVTVLGNGRPVFVLDVPRLVEA